MSQIAIVLGVYLVAMLGIGLYGRKYAGNFTEYLTAAKQTTIVMLIGTGIGAHIGSGFVVGGAAAGASDGLSGAWYGIGCGLCYVLTSFTIAKWINRHGYVTLSDYFKERYGDRGTSLIYSVSTAFAYLGILAAQIMAGKAIFEGFGMNGTLGAVICAVVVLVYASMSGLWGAYMTSVIQTVIIVVGMVAAYIFLIAKGGWGVITANLPAEYFEMVPAKLGLSGLVMTVVPVTLSCFTDQGAYQRCSSSKSPNVAFTGHLIAALCMIPLAFLPAIIGMYGAAVYPDAPTSGVFFTVLLNEFPGILSAVMIASVLSAIMSTADMSFLSISATVLHDIYAGMINKNVDDKKLLKLSTVLNIVVCIMSLGMALVFTNIISLLSMTYSFMVAGCTLPLVGGIFWKKSTVQGSIAAAATGIILTLVDAFMVRIPYASLTTLIPVTIVFIAVSLFTYKEGLTPKSAA